MPRPLLFLMFLLAAAPAMAATAMVEAERDATLIEDPAGLKANGSGPVFFAGRNNQSQNSIRRGLIRFDVAAALPAGAIVEAAWLDLVAVPGNPPPAPVQVHRLLAGWEEGPSTASGGGGAPSRPGDVTWIHTLFDLDFWVKPGGHFVAFASAGLTVGDAGPYSWSSPALARDVSLWAHAPRANHGWILLGDETTGQTAKVFASREGGDASLRPRLRILYRLPGEIPSP